MNGKFRERWVIWSAGQRCGICIGGLSEWQTERLSFENELATINIEKFKKRHSIWFILQSTLKILTLESSASVLAILSLFYCIFSMVFISRKISFFEEEVQIYYTMFTVGNVLIRTSVFVIKFHSILVCSSSKKLISSQTLNMEVR